MNRAVFLDRDGVINEALINNCKPFAPLNFGEFKLDKYARESYKRIEKAGYIAVIVTNQPEIARGNLDTSELLKMHELIKTNIGIKHIYVCTHDDEDHCNCRKPLPGLIMSAAEELNIDLKSSFLIGDRWKDIEAGQRAGCGCIWINRSYDEAMPKGRYIETLSLEEATMWIVNKKF